MTKVNLIVPSALELFDPTAYQNLGLLYLGGALKKAGIACKYVDMSDTEEIPDADYHLITVLQATYNYALDISNRIKKENKGKVIIGGIEVTINREKAEQDFKPWCTVTGEAELLIPTIIKEDWQGHIPCGLIQNLDNLPFPDRDLIPLEKLRNVSGIHGDRFDGDGASTTILTSRGCPYKCAFCCKIPQTSYFRWRSANNVYAEMKEIKEKYDINHFRIIDDCFTANKRRIFDLCSLLKQEKFYWMCCTRSDLVNPLLLSEMHKAGCREIAFGIETASPKLLKTMCKDETVEQYEKGIKMTKEAGIKVKTLLMEGYPGETQEDVELTKKFIERVQPDKWTLSRYVPLNGSALVPKSDGYGKFFYPLDESEFKLWLKGESWRGKC